jgi:tRNA threonylcarbamoyl adenosine modification protein YeaZ
MFLAIDSTWGTSVALVDLEGSTLHEATSEDPRAHAEKIGQLIHECFELSNLTPQDVTAVVMGVGPGPFTGLRVGMAAATAFSVSRDLPLLPVVSHDALGWAGDENVVVVTDARRGEVAYSVYQAGAPYRRVVGPALTTPDKLDELLGVAAGFQRNDTSFVSAGALAQVAVDFIANGLDFPSPAPIYLRAPDVTVVS